MLTQKDVVNLMELELGEKYILTVENMFIKDTKRSGIFTLKWDVQNGYIFINDLDFYWKLENLTLEQIQGIKKVEKPKEKLFQKNCQDINCFTECPICMSCDSVKIKNNNDVRFYPKLQQRWDEIKNSIEKQLEQDYEEGKECEKMF